MISVTSCLGQAGDGGLLLVAALICVCGIYATFSLAAHAGRSQGPDRRRWGVISIVAAGATAWASHMIGLLAFRPGMDAAFEPILTALSLLTGVAGIGAGTWLAMRLRQPAGRFAAGVVMGVGVTGLHYLGQLGYVVRGQVEWRGGVVAASIASGLLLSGLAMLAGGARLRFARKLSPPLLIVAIAIIHFPGMAAMRLVFDPRVDLPRDAVPPMAVAPVVAAVSLWLIALAFVGLRKTLQAQSRLRRDRERVKELSALAVEGLIVSDGRFVLTANASLGRIYGAEANEMEGLELSALLPEIDVAALGQLEEQAAQLRARDGAMVPVRLVRSEVSLGDKRRMVLAVRDQRERLRTEAALKMLAHHDQLTGLINRSRFCDLLAVQAASRRSRDQAFSVLMVDLDHFKPVNDVLGHAAGDAVLRMTADRLRSALREGDVLARLGGDEFVVLQLDAGGQSEALALAARIVDVMQAPMMVNDQAVRIGASVGVALAPQHGDDAGVLLHNADLALYAAKSDGKGVYRLFDPALDARMQARRKLEMDLRRAVAAEEFELHFQPLVEAGSGRIAGAEALVRWNHPERGQVSPVDFIALAEETGLILPLGEWVLRRACQEAARWPPELSVSVNLSPVQFRDRNLGATVRSALADSGLSAMRLELEITEGVLLTDEVSTLATLKMLRNEGVRIAMDDFGTGYSSLGYLRRFPFDKIKVDQSFVRQVPSDPESAGIVRAILSIGSCLGMSTTMEGVETPEQMAFSAAEGCTFVQGYLISRPLTAEAVRDFFGAGRFARAPLELEAVDC